MQALIRDIQLARHNIEMVFYIWQPAAWPIRSPNH
jgi:cardiolipin synthase